MGKHGDYQWGAYEAFADEMMFWLHDCQHQMKDIEMFLRFTRFNLEAVA